MKLGHRTKLLPPKTKLFCEISWCRSICAILRTPLTVLVDEDSTDGTATF